MIKKFLASLGYALKGVCIGINEERNVRIDIVALLFVTRFSLFYDFDKTQRALVILMAFLVLSAELMNTAVERAVFLPDNDHYSSAGQAKDTAAGAVLVLAIASILIGVILFFDMPVLKQIYSYYTSNILRLIILIISIIVSYIFIIKDTIFKKDK